MSLAKENQWLKLEVRDGEGNIAQDEAMTRVGRQAVGEELSQPNLELLTGLHERYMESA